MGLHSQSLQGPQSIQACVGWCGGMGIERTMWEDSPVRS